LLRANGQQEIAVDKRNHYWILDCILALTAIALGTAALCSFIGVALPPRLGWVSSIEVLVCVAALIVGALFAGFVWREQRQPGRRHAVRAHQERHALMMRRASQLPAIGVAEPAPVASAETKDTPETLLVTSLTDVKAERRVQRRQQARKAAEAVAATAA
jgi:uncharacterized iron-regulated membrane protein